MDEVLVGNTQGDAFAVEVHLEDGFRQGATRRLFKLAPTDFYLEATSDHQRFLIGERKDNSAGARLDVVIGWPQLIEGQ